MHISLVFENSPSTLTLRDLEELLSIHAYPAHLLLALTWPPWGAQQKVFVQNNHSWRRSSLHLLESLINAGILYSQQPPMRGTYSLLSPPPAFVWATCGSQDGLLSLPQPKRPRETAAWELGLQTFISAVSRRGLGACPPSTCPSGPAGTNSLALYKSCGYQDSGIIRIQRSNQREKGMGTNLHFVPTMPLERS